MLRRARGQHSDPKLDNGSDVSFGHGQRNAVTSDEKLGEANSLAKTQGTPKEVRGFIKDEDLLPLRVEQRHAAARKNMMANAWRDSHG